MAFKPETGQVLGAIPDFVGGILKGSCNLLTKGEQKADCEKANVVTNKISDQQARLNRAIVVTYQSEVRKQCGPTEWTNVKKSITDSYKQQIVRQGGNPNKVIVNYRDNEGNLTSKTPDYSKTILDELKASGVLTAANPDDPKVMLMTPVKCTPSAPYQSKFPDNSENPNTAPYVDPKNL